MSNLAKRKKAGKIFVGIGIFFVVIFVYSIITRMMLKLEMDSTVEAYHVTIDSYKPRQGSRTYRPSYAYEVEGKNYIYTPSASSTVKSYKMNDPTIYYDSSNPAHAVAEYEVGFDAGFITLLIFAGVFGGLGIKFLKE